MGTGGGGETCFVAKLSGLWDGDADAADDDVELASSRHMSARFML